jgi:ABC-2 type transport system ATP-binding protein
VSAEAALEWRDVAYAYPGNAPVIDGFSLAVARGEIVCLLGPNGAGKTTLVRLATGQLAPDAGEVRCLGARVERGPVPSLGVIPQAAGLFGGLPVRTHLAEFARLKGLSRSASLAAADTALAVSGLGELRDTPCGRLSDGDRRRVLVAIALLGDPAVLVLDEPTVGLDAGARRAVWDALRELAQAGRALLVTTQYMAEAERLADRVAVLHGGRMLRLASLPELLAQAPRRYRVSEFDAASGRAAETHFFDSLLDANDFVEQRRLASYAVSPSTLEDVYLALVSGAREGGPRT